MKKHWRTNTLNLLATLPLILAGQTINAVSYTHLTLPTT